MSTRRQSTAQLMRPLVRSLLERHPDLAVTSNNTLGLTPIRHVARQIWFDSWPSRGYFQIQWRLTELFIRGYKRDHGFGRCFGLVGRSTRFKPKGTGGLWEWDDPTVAGDFIDQVETEILPVLRPLDTLQAFVAFAETIPYVGIVGDRLWMAVTRVALGDLDAAREHWAAFRPGQVWEKRFPSLSHSVSVTDAWWDAFDEALRDGDRKALAEKLHAVEAEDVIRRKLGRHWRRTPYPLEQTA